MISGTHAMWIPILTFDEACQHRLWENWTVLGGSNRIMMIGTILAKISVHGYHFQQRLCIRMRAASPD